MDWTEEQKQNILKHYNSVEEYEAIEAERQAQEYLNETDYVVIKHYEYELTGETETKDYKEVYKKRKEARKTIEKARKELEKLEKKEEKQEEKETKTE